MNYSYEIYILNVLCYFTDVTSVMNYNYAIYSMRHVLYTERHEYIPCVTCSVTEAPSVTNHVIYAVRHVLRTVSK